MAALGAVPSLQSVAFRLSALVVPQQEIEKVISTMDHGMFLDLPDKAKRPLVIEAAGL